MSDTMKNFSDVIVVGGGPSGSFCAFNLAKKAVKVMVFEEHNEIGVPCHCAGHLSINGLKGLGLYPLPRGVLESIFYGAKFYSPKGSEFSIRFPSPATCAVNRTLFDRYLSQLAEKAGAHYLLGSKVEHLVFKKDRVEVSTLRTSGETAKFYGKIVVDAEGVAYKVVREAGLRPPSKNSLVYCVNADVENVKDVESDEVEVFLGNTYAPGFYAWLIPKEEGKAKVGLGAKVGNPKNLLRKLMYKHPAASKKLKRAKVVKESFHPIPLGGPIERAYSNRFIIVGDAASQVKPTTGGGVILGLNCAKAAAKTVVDAINSQNFSAKFLRAYQKSFQRFLGFDMLVMREIRKMLNILSDEKLDDFIGFCKKNFGENGLQDLGDIDFQGRMLLKALRKPRNATVIMYFASLIFRSAFKRESIDKIWLENC
ncbi:MAG: NAD(P)/FAD-dependent oxidoreductase [Candidatus Bathyarchaeia archaeon]